MKNRIVEALALVCAASLGAGATAADVAPEPSGPMAEAAPPSSRPVLDREELLGAFLADHWTLPIPLQGEPPEGWSAFEASLNPEACGACHPLQYKDWQTSLHAKAYSPGFSGQLVEGSLSRPRSLRNCQTCHTPLEEQQPVTAAGGPNPAYDAGLRAQGMVCATCHVRAHERRGPPRRPDLAPLAANLPHGGFAARAEFTESRFCASCHQFFGRPGPSGRPVQNTFVEWQESPQAAAGETCQSCHMPDRAHLWRGIHDPEMVRAATEVTFGELLVTESRVEARLVLRSHGVGHMLPTYTTPRLFMQVVQVDEHGDELPDSLEVFEIGRRVDFRKGLDLADTRIAPGQSATLHYARELLPEARGLVGRVRVEPAFHYRGVFASLAKRYETSQAKELMREALKHAAGTPYKLRELRLEF